MNKILSSWENLKYYIKKYTNINVDEFDKLLNSQPESEAWQHDYRKANMVYLEYVRLGSDEPFAKWVCDKMVEKDNDQPESEPKCGCGKTAKEHDSLRLLGIHHYWYFHKLPMDGCPYCQDKE